MQEYTFKAHPDMRYDSPDATRFTEADFRGIDKWMKEEARLTRTADKKHRAEVARQRAVERRAARRLKWFGTV